MLTFVTSDHKGKLNNAEQRRVRSHVLRRRERLEPEDLDERRGSSILPQSAQGHLHHFRVSRKGPKGKGHRSTNDYSWAELEDNDGAQTPDEIPTYNQSSVKSQPVFIPNFSFNLDLESFGILCTYHPMVLNFCSLKNMGFKCDNHSAQWRGWIMENEAYCHAALVLSDSARGRLYGSNLSKLGFYHAAKAVSHLNQSLSNSPLTLQDSTIATIINLGAASTLLGDFRTASAHVSGLWSIIHLRGGIDSFWDNPYLLISVCRLDIELLLALGKSRCVHKDASIISGRQYQQLRLLAANYSQAPQLNCKRNIQGVVDQRLALIFHDMQHILQDFSKATMGGYTISEAEFGKRLLLIQYTLLLLEDQLCTIIDECVWMVLLAVTTTIWVGECSKLDLEYAYGRVDELCQAIDISSSPEEQELMLWILMMGLISSMLNLKNEWIHNRWQRDLAALTQGMKWDDVRQKLQGFFWIDACHDTLGKYYFDMLSISD